MARGRRGLIASQAALTNGQWTGEQLAKYVNTGQLGEQKRQVEKYDQNAVKRLTGH